MLNRPRVPITNLPVVIPPKAPVIDPHNGTAAQSAWTKWLTVSSTASGMVIARARQHLSQSLWDLNH